MKKFLFSAVALTVFSFSALANNEVKEEKKTETKETKVEVEAILKDTQIFIQDEHICCIFYEFAWEMCEDEGLTNDQCMTVANIVYNNCMNEASPIN